VTTVTLTTTTTPRLPPDTCNVTDVRLPNGTCISNILAQTLSASIVRNTTDPITRANYLELYFVATLNSNTINNASDKLNPIEIDTAVDRLRNASVILSTNNTFILSQPITRSGNLLLGAKLQNGFGGSVVDNSTQATVFNQSVSAAAVLNENSLANITALSMSIVGKPTIYRNIDNTTGKAPVSPVVISSVSTIGSLSNSFNISFIFQQLQEYSLNGNGTFLCSFWN